MDDLIAGLRYMGHSEAQAATDAACAGNGDPHDSDKALEEMDKGQQELDDGEPDKAMKHYRKAWHNAQNAPD